MKKYLILIAGAAISYSMVGAAASKLTVTQATIPAQGSYGETVGSCASAVTVQYAYEDESGTPVDIAEGTARKVSAILVIPAENTCENGAEFVDKAALSFAKEDPAFFTDPTDSQGLPVSVDYAEALTGSYNGDIETLVGSGGAWEFVPTSPIAIEDFEPGVITVTLWREPAS